MSHSLLFLLSVIFAFISDCHQSTEFSLAFVFDTTGSMGDDLKQVREGVRKIVAKHTSKGGDMIKDFIVVPFHDPDVGPAQHTENSRKFLRMMEMIYPQGGGDCPEMSVTGIKLALERALPNSLVYVFTDASAKDYKDVEKVNELIQKKQSQVTFVLTGICNGTEDPAYRVYRDIATMSSGEVYIINKTVVKDFMGIVESAVESKRVHVFQEDTERPGTKIYEVPVDSHLSSITLHLTNQNENMTMNVTIRDPQGKQVTELDGLKRLMKSVKSVYVASLKKPIPGKWTLEVATKSKRHSVRISGVSEVDFIQGFSSSEVKNNARTSRRPLKGVKNFMMANITGQYTGNIDMFHILHVNGTAVVSLEVEQTDSFPIYASAYPFTIDPESAYYIKVTGEDSKGYKLQRYSKIALTPRDLRGVSVTCPPKVQVKRGQTANISCFIDSEIRFIVKWYKNNVLLTNSEEIYIQSTNVTFTVNNANEQSQGRYSVELTTAEKVKHLKGNFKDDTILNVLPVPPSLYILSNASVQPNSPATLTCQVLSEFPNVVIRWLRAEPRYELENSRRYRIVQNLLTNSSESLVMSSEFTIRRAIESDSGEYICEAEHPGGKASTYGSIKIQRPPTAMLDKSKVSFKKGGTIRLLCRTDGMPPPMISWNFNDIPVVSGPRITIENEYMESILEVRQAASTDEGTYTCVAVNDAGKEQGDAIVTYIEEPRIERIDKFPDVSVEKQPLKLRCLAVGSPKPTIKWEFNGSPVSENAIIRFNGTIGELSISEVDRKMKGQWTCMVRNEAGTVRKSIILDVGYPPKISDFLNDVKVNYGEDITLKCNVEGEPKPNVKWFRGSESSLEPINYGNRITIGRDNSLRINKVSLEDKGQYTCTAVNSHGKDFGTLRLSVGGTSPPVITFTPIKQIAVQGENQKILTCAVFNDKPKATVVWLFKGAQLENSNKYLIKNGSLYIKNVALDDEGVYMCIAKNIVGKAEFEISLDVQTKPTIEGKQKLNLTVIQGEQLELKCDAEGDPTPILEWRQDGKPLTPQPGSSILFSGDNKILTIYHATSTHAGTITCTAKNKYGFEVKEFSITVRVPPNILRDGKTDFEIGKGESSILTCKAVGPGIVSRMNWFKDGKPLVSIPGRVKFINQNSIEVFGKSQDETGSYECRAKNDAGQDSKFFQVTVLLPPETASKDIIKRYVNIGEEVTLACNIDGYPTPTKTWRFKGAKIALNNNGYDIQPHATDPNNVYIRSMTSDLQGIYACEGVNRGGSASLVYEVIILKRPEIVNIPEISTVIIKNAITLTCEAMGSPNPKISWLFKNKEIAEDTLGYRFVGDGTMIISNAEFRNGGIYTCVAQNKAGKAMKNTTVVVYDPGTDGNGGGSGTDGNGNPLNITNIPTTQGNNITFSCVMNSNPPPKLSWYKDDTPIQEVLDQSRYRISDDGITLTIYKVTRADKGKFKCQASNLNGRTKDFILVVNISPEISKRFSSSMERDVMAGDNVEIRCSADGVPDPKMEWYKGNQKVFPSRFVEIKDEGSLLILKEVKIEDEGVYLCIAKNLAGKDEAEFKVNVLVPPKIAGPDREQPELPKGRQYSLYCNVTGYPQPIIQWSSQDPSYLAKYTRELDNGAKLLFLNVTPDVVTRYSCTATNRAGVAYKMFDPIVTYPPEIANMNENTQRWVLMGGELRLSCDATGSPNPTIEWYKDGELVQNGDYARINISSNNMQLHLFNTQDGDTGTYKCVASNKFGSVRKQWKVEIKVPPRINAFSKGEKLVPLDSRFSLFCVATGKPTPEIQWLKDSMPINTTKVTVGTNNNEITINKAQESDAGRYQCRVENRYGYDTKTMDVKVTYAPRLEMDGQRYYRINKTVGGSALLECLVTGSPQPKIIWTKNGEEFLDSSPFRLRLLNNNRQLEITRISQKDAARYTCRASNAFGSLEVVHEVTVGAPARIDRLRINSEYLVKEGETLELLCPASGSPKPKVRFSKDTTPIGSTDNSRILVSQERNTMTIFKTVKSDTAMYQCNASNSIGWDLVNYIVRVQTLPAFDESNMQKEVHWVLNQTRSLECMLQKVADPPAKITWERKDSTVTNTPNVKVSPDGTRLTVMNVQHYDEGQYTCIAHNSVGRVRMDFFVIVYVKPSFLKDESYVNFEAVQNRTVQLSCEALGQPKPEFIWYRKDREISSDQRIYPNMALIRGEQILQIINIQRNDASIYSCSVTNAGGTISKTFNVTVAVPPRIKKRTHGIESMILSKDKVATLECFIYDQDKIPVRIVWYKDDNPILTEDSDYYLLGNKGHTLSILRPSSEETGVYTCDVSNKAGSDRHSFQVTVISPPKFPPNFMRYREKITVSIRSSVNMPCPASGSPDPIIRWYFNGNVLNHYLTAGMTFKDDDKSLELLSTAGKDAGEYKCVATNKGGNISKTYILEITIPPLVNLDNTEFSEREGSTFTVRCTAEGFPKPEIIWTRDDGRGLFRLGTSANPETGFLTITNAQASDSGRYTCTASNKVGQDEKSIEVEIKVPPRIVTSKSPIQAKVGTETLLPCQVSGSEPISVDWTMPSETQIPQSGLPGFRKMSNGLLIEEVKKEHGGRYRCGARNSAGYQTVDVTLDVLVPPKLERPSNRTVIGMINSVLNIQCKIEDGQPTPEIFWERNGKRFGRYNTYYSVSEDGRFVFNSLKPTDEGDLTCIARNIAGEDSVTLRIIVESEPKVYLPISFLGYEGRSVTMKCIVDGKPRPDVIWHVNGQPMGILGDRVRKIKDNEITINDIKPSDEGIYECIGRKRGESATVRASTHLTVFTKPIFKSTPKKVVYYYEGQYIQFTCTADGNPKPEISWFKDNNQLPVLPMSHMSHEQVNKFINNTDFDVGGSDTFETTSSFNGNGRYSFGPLGIRHAGIYGCAAENKAGKILYNFELVVKTRPSVTVYQNDEPVSESNRTSLECKVKGEAQSIIWLKDGHVVKNSSRIMITDSSILTIYNTVLDDAGIYQCVATNAIGDDRGEVKLLIRSKPKFTELPSNMSVSRGDIAYLTCAAKGYPIPRIGWFKDNRRVQLSETKTLVKNGTLRIVGISGEDSGLYTCVARNDMGEIYSPVAKLLVMIHGGWSAWGNWTDCSTSCGRGTTTRRRTCTNPKPQNGGLPCFGESTSTQTCLIRFCPTDGHWSQWSPWTPCGTTCGAGIRQRTRSCDSPPPTNGGKQCSGEAMEDVMCENNPGCPLDGAWSPWSPWSDCTVTCGDMGGTQKKVRKCNNPPPANNGQFCPGKSHYVRACSLLPCPQSGKWSEWGYWSSCSQSCGNGTQRRMRTCTNPSPSPEGPDCEGENIQKNQCNANPCPINGEWSNWSSWGACSTTCGSGVRYRNRSCTEPSPQFNGKLCPGIAKEAGICSDKACPVAGGRWSAWSGWSQCSETCGSNGRKQRSRVCLSQDCIGRDKESASCVSMLLCPDSNIDKPGYKAMGEIRGLLNERDIGVVYMNASWLNHEKQTNFDFKLSNLMPKDQPCFKILTGLFSPIFWIGAYQVENASNGHTVTGGDFTRESTVQFTDGSKLRFSHMVRRNNQLVQMRTSIHGKCPNIPSDADIQLNKYVEHYVQMNPALSLIHSYSNRFYLRNQIKEPYSWNHNITSRPGNKQRYLVQQLIVDNINLLTDSFGNSMRFTASAIIAKDDNGDSCPSGFEINSNFCSDVNECTDHMLNKCEHICENNVPSFRCRCREGFVLSEDGQSCLDINECATQTHKCLSSQQCINTHGSYKCLMKCQLGFRMRQDGSGCEDIDECVEKSNICGIHRCVNSHGSYTCRCRPGYQLEGINCIDIDECKENLHQCAPHQKCRNIPGNHLCEEVCDRGYKLDAKQNCVDIDECRTREAQCPEGAHCINRAGTFQCRCLPGFELAGSRCDDIDECAAEPSPCSHQCHNTWGSYECTCAPGETRSLDKKRCFSKRDKCEDGFKWNPLANTCLDIDECKPSSGFSPCQDKCVNTQGSYYCECQSGFMLVNQHCKDINECSLNKNLCEPQELCFNTIGSYVCTRVNCPNKYIFDKRKRTCKILCSDSELSCPHNSKYADTIQFLNVNMPGYVNATAKIKVVNTQQRVQRNCDFDLLDNSPNNPCSYQSRGGTIYLRRTTSALSRFASGGKNANPDNNQQTELYYMFFRVKCYETSMRARLTFQNSFYIYITFSKYTY